MKFEFLSPRQQLVEIMNRIYYGGMTTLSGGNLSILDSDGSIWITPAGIDKGNLTAQDIIRALPDGTCEGPHRPSSEIPFHRAIYRQRPDVHAIVHAHSPALVTFSIVRKIPDTNLIPQARRVCGKVGYAPYALPGSEALGASIAHAFSEGFDAVLLENHGVATSGRTLLEAFQRLETLDFCARTQMYAQGLGPITTLTDLQIDLLDHDEHLLPELASASHSSRERELRAQLVDIIQRAVQRHLMISTEGVASARITEESFLITPTGVDRSGIDQESLVLIEKGQRQMGKLPSRSVRLHQAIYAQNAQVNSIITAQAPYVTAYAVSEKVLDSKTIPESYIMLQDVPKASFGKQYREPQEIARLVAAGSPVVLLQNDCVLTTGRSVLQAFDRLEVAEFTARSLIETASLGPLVPIDDHEIAALKAKFLS
jgi:L-fuculose-phosphate aldolase